MTQTSTVDETGRSTTLLRSSIKFFHIVLMVTAAAAPLVVASTYIPISISSGSGMATPLTYAITTVILLIFSVGFAQMAKRITSAGAFYTFSTQGLGRPTGLAVGFTILAAYSMIAAAISGGFGYFAAALFSDHLGIDLPWYFWSIVAFVLMFVFSYYRVTLTAKILGVFLTLEVLVVFIVAAATVLQGGAEGQMPSAFSPSELGAAPALGIGFFLAFWSWIGFETTAIYGEETKDPKASVPRATYIAVLTLGVFYTFASYAAIVAFGSQSVDKATELLGGYYFEMASLYTTPAVRTAMDVLVVTGFFACTFAFNNNASRYFYSLGRDHILPKPLGYTHPKHHSPHIAALVQTVIAIVTVALFALGGADPLLQLGTWLPIFCTLAVIVVQLVVCFAVIGYFNRVGRNGGGDVLKTLVAPLVGALAQAWIIYLLIENLTFLAASEETVVKLIPLFVAIVAIVGFVYALILRGSAPQRYERIGMLHDDEMMEAFVDEKAILDDQNAP
ncbi:MAG: APC family permease [Dehalococcoidia bacterium]